MFCINCGKPTEEGKLLCNDCAAQQAAAQQPVQPPVEAQPVVEQPVVQVVEPAPQPVVEPAPQPVVEQPVFVQPAEPVQPVFVQPEQPVWQNVQQPEQPAPAVELNMPGQQPPKKKKKGLVGLIAVIAAVVALAVGGWFAKDYIASFFNRNLSKPQDYNQSVESKALENGSMLDIACSLYGRFLDSLQNPKTNAEVDYTLELGSSLTSLLETAVSDSGGELDLDWLENVLLELDYNMTEDGIAMMIGAGLNDERALSVDAVIDWDEGMLYMAFPELNDEYVGVEMDDMDIDPDMFGELSGQAMEMNKDLAKELPDEAAFRKMLSKYIQLALSQIEEVEKETETVEVDGLEQEFTVLTYKIYEKDLLKIAEAVLKEAQDDEELRAVVEAFCNYMNSYTAMMAEYSYDVDELDLDADEIFDSIPDALEALEEVETSKDNYLTMKTFVDYEDHIQGRSLKVSGEGMKMSYITVTEGKEFAFEAIVDNGYSPVEITGGGTKKGDKVTAEYVLAVDGEEGLTVEFADFDMKALREGQLSGTIGLYPSGELLSEMTYDMPSYLSSIIGGKLGIELTVEPGEEGSTVSVSLVTGAGKLLTLGADSKAGSGSKKLDIPSSWVDAMDDEAMQQWAESLDMDSVLESLEDAGLPREFVEMLEQMLVAEQAAAGQATVEYPSVYDDYT